MNPILKAVTLILCILIIPILLTSCLTNQLDLIGVTPVNTTIGVGTTQQFAATGFYSDMLTNDITSSVIWTSSNTSVATINSAGLVKAVGAGTTTITAASGSISNPITLTVASVAAGNVHSIALKSDGTVWDWGGNSFGELGDGTTQEHHAPMFVSGISGVTAIAGADYHTTALKSDGTVWGWGNNYWGQLGNGTLIDSFTPVQVSGLSGITAIASGGDSTIALKSDGTVWTWGRNQYGQLGNGTTTNSSTPVQVSGLSGITAISGGGTHIVALKSDGTVWCWGDNQYGELGNGTTTNSSTPVQVSGLTGVTAIAGGVYYNSVALKSDGTVWGWGFNNYGQLGNGTTTNSSTPVQVSGLSGVTVIASGGMYNLAIKSDGTVWTWGLNSSGQLGNGTTTNSSTPVQVSGLTGVTAIAGALGSSSCIALKSNGTVWTWGDNQYGQLGDGTTTNSSTPVEAGSTSFNLTTDNATLSSITVTPGSWNIGKTKTNQFTAVGVYSDRSLQVLNSAIWSSSGAATINVNGLATGVSVGSTVISAAFGGVTGTAGATVISLLTQSISAGNNFNLALKSDGTVWGWGASVDITNTPKEESVISGVTAIASGGGLRLALKSDGSVWAWGNNNNGQIGNGTTINSYIPVQVGGLTGITAIAAGYKFSLALKSDGTVWAWGDNTYGQLGIGSADTNAHSTPVQVSGLSGVTIRAIAAGVYYTIALDSSGNVWTWGRNNTGQLGNNSTTDSSTPVHVMGLSGVGFLSGISAIAAVGQSTLALTTTNIVYAWGDNQYGQLGDGTTILRKTPVQVSGLSGITAIAGDWHNSMALKSDGTVWTWGDNNHGQLGNGTTTNSSIPVQVSGLSGITAISGGYDNSLALKSDGTVWAWGDNEYGELGNGTNDGPDNTNLGTGNPIPHSTPLQVLGAGGSGYLNLN